MNAASLLSEILHPTLKRLLLLLALASALILGAALVSQYVFGLYPCTLCVYQRYPYMMVIALGLLAALLPLSPRTRMIAAALCALLLLADAGIAAYHTGVELEWFKGPDACASKSSEGATLEELRREIMEAPLVSCSQAMGYVFGLSLAAWNTIFASALTLYALLNILRLRRSR